MQETHPFRPLPWRPWTDVLLLFPLADDRPPACLFLCRLARAGSKNVYWLVGKDNESRTNSLLEREIFALHGTVRNKEQHQPPARMMSSTSGPPATPSLFPGVPPPVGHVDVSDLDPALDECCRRDEEEQRRGSALRTVLRHHDRIAAAERARNLRNLVTLTAGGGSEMGPAGSFQGCRCCYDPHRDGGGDYRALLELRAEQQPRLLPSNDDFGDHDDREPLEAAGKSDLSGSDSDSDAELDAMLEGLDVGGSAGALHSGSGEATSSSSSAVAWEERRRRELEEALRYRQTALEHGYGAHRPVHPSRVWTDFLERQREKPFESTFCGGGTFGRSRLARFGVTRSIPGTVGFQCRSTGHNLCSDRWSVGVAVGSGPHSYLPPPFAGGIGFTGLGGHSGRYGCGCVS